MHYNNIEQQSMQRQTHSSAGPTTLLSSRLNSQLKSLPFPTLLSILSK